LTETDRLQLVLHELWLATSKEGGRTLGERAHMTHQDRVDRSDGWIFLRCAPNRCAKLPLRFQHAVDFLQRLFPRGRKHQTKLAQGDIKRLFLKGKVFHIGFAKTDTLLEPCFLSSSLYNDSHGGCHIGCDNLGCSLLRGHQGQRSVTTRYVQNTAAV